MTRALPYKRAMSMSPTGSAVDPHETKVGSSSFEDGMKPSPQPEEQLGRPGSRCHTLGITPHPGSDVESRSAGSINPKTSGSATGGSAAAASGRPARAGTDSADEAAAAPAQRSSSASLSPTGRLAGVTQRCEMLTGGHARMVTVADGRSRESPEWTSSHVGKHRLRSVTGRRRVREHGQRDSRRPAPAATRGGCDPQRAQGKDRAEYLVVYRMAGGTRAITPAVLRALRLSHGYSFTKRIPATGTHSVCAVWAGTQSWRSRLTAC